MSQPTSIPQDSQIEVVADNILSLMSASAAEKVIRFMDKHQWKLLHFAAYTDWPEETIKLLLKTIAVPNPSQIDVDSLAEALGWEVKTLMNALKSCSDVNTLDKHKRTCLHIAANRDNYRFVRSLMKLKSVDINALDERGWSAMHYAAKQGHGRVMTCLCLKHGEANIKSNDGGRTPIHFAAMEGHVHIIRMLYYHGKADITLITNKGRNVVHLAASNTDNYDALRVFLEMGYFDVNTPDHSGNTALHYACECGGTDMIEMLVSEFNANVNSVDKTKQTPAHIAAYNGDLESLEYLVSHGADITLLDEDNTSVLTYAEEEDHAEVVDFIKEQLASQS